MTFNLKFEPLTHISCVSAPLVVFMDVILIGFHSDPTAAEWKQLFRASLVWLCRGQRSAFIASSSLNDLYWGSHLIIVGGDDLLGRNQFVGEHNDWHVVGCLLLIQIYQGTALGIDGSLHWNGCIDFSPPFRVWIYIAWEKEFLLSLFYQYHTMRVFVRNRNDGIHSILNMASRFDSLGEDCCDWTMHKNQYVRMKIQLQWQGKQQNKNK